MERDLAQWVQFNEVSTLDHVGLEGRVGQVIKSHLGDLFSVRYFDLTTREGVTVAPVRCDAINNITIVDDRNREHIGEFPISHVNLAEICNRYMGISSSNKINMTKVVRFHTGLTLKQSLMIVEFISTIRKRENDIQKLQLEITRLREELWDRDQPDEEATKNAESAAKDNFDE